MIKEPRAGRVKTRLARDMGTVAATRAYRLMLDGLLRRLSRNASWTTSLAITPPGIRNFSMLPAATRGAASVPYFQQRGETLGARLHHAMRLVGPGRVVIIGSDCPDICDDDIAAAFRSLSRSDAVIGPSPDGGYWLIGLKNSARISVQTFADVRWSSDHARSDTIIGLKRACGIRDVALLRPIEDCDDLASYRRLEMSIVRRVRPTESLSTIPSSAA